MGDGVRSLGGVRIPARVGGGARLPHGRFLGAHPATRQGCRGTELRGERGSTDVCCERRLFERLLHRKSIDALQARGTSTPSSAPMLGGCRHLCAPQPNRRRRFDMVDLVPVVCRSALPCCGVVSCHWQCRHLAQWLGVPAPGAHLCAFSERIPGGERCFRGLRPQAASASWIPWRADGRHAAGYRPTRPSFQASAFEELLPEVRGPRSTAPRRQVRGEVAGATTTATTTTVA